MYRSYRIIRLSRQLGCTVPAVLFILLSATVLGKLETMPGDGVKSFHRLPTDVLPCHYDIKLIPDLTTYILHGSEDIYVDIKQSTDTIVLNAQNINIEKATFHKKDGSETTATTVEVSTSEETAKMIFPEQLPVGKGGYLSINFTGEIGDNLKGMYRSKYIGDNGEIKYAITTQFEPTDARRCFPCWDEPLHKATFNISVEIPKGLTAISNMPIKNKTMDGSKEIINFEKTPIMSTYLIAIVIGEFDYVEGESKDGVLVRIYTAKTKQEQGKFALDVTTRALPYYKSYFGIAYPLAKLDLIAVKDISFGAMENWGAIIYRDTCLLVEPHHTSTVNKQSIALTVSHELAHQWFGNLVTMKWWTHLWLNEGYATFNEYLCVDNLFPEYEIWNQFVTDIYNTALQLDALKNSHPIEVPVEHPGEINEVFDVISYQKGASIIRMLYSFIGDEKFRKGMNLYLNRHIYSNAETEDLWAALEDASNKPIRRIMPTWTKQQGFPIVKVEQRQDGGNRILSLSQKRFLADGSEDTENNLWLIPITVSTMQNPNDIVFNAVMENKTTEFVIKDVPENNWVKLNPGAVGFYRTHYSEDMMKLLLPSIKNLTLPPLDRLGIYDDTFAMVQAGQISTVELLRLTESFQKEDNFLVWSNMIDSLKKIAVIVSNSDFEEAYETFVRKLLRNVSQTLGWDPKPNENHSNTIFRMLVLRCMVDFNDEETIKEAKKRFEQHLSGTKILAVDVRSVVYRAVLSVGNSDTYENMLKLYRKTDLDEEKERILRAFGALKNEILLTKALDFIMSDEVNTQGILEAVSTLGLTYTGRVLTWEFIKKKWNILIERFASGLILPRLIKYSTQYFTTEEYAKDIEDFFKKNPVPGTERTVQQCLEKIKLQAAWFERDRNGLKEYLLSHA